MEKDQNLGHTAVMCEEAVNALFDDNVSGGGRVFVDATFGAGGHSRVILERLSPKDQLIAFDCDEFAALEAKKIEQGNFYFVYRNYSELETVLKEKEIDGIAGILFDLGVSSMQLDTAQRGFSFRANGNLDMRMDRRQGQTVALWLAHSREEDIYYALKHYGEEPEARRLSRAIFNARHRLSTTEELATLVCQTKKQPRQIGKHPATRVFQALRIVINNELETIKKGLEAAARLLLVGGRLVVIAFHSLEDRIVKHFSAGESFPGIGRIRQYPLSPVGGVRHPSPLEVSENVRARSACLRVFIKTEQMV